MKTFRIKKSENGMKSNNLVPVLYLMAFTLFTSCYKRELNRSVDAYFIPENIVVLDSVKIKATLYAFLFQYDLGITGVFGNSGYFVAIEKQSNEITKEDWIINSDWINKIELIHSDTLLIHTKYDEFHQFKSSHEKIVISIYADDLKQAE